MTFRGPREAALREHDRDGLARDELRLVDRLRGLALDDQGAALVAVLLGELRDLGLDELRELGLRLQRLLEIRPLLGQRLLLAADLHLLELGEMAQLELEDRLGLRVGDLEALHEDGLRLVLAADDLDDLVDVQIGDEQAVQDVQPLRDALQAVLEPAFDRRRAELQPLLEQRLSSP